MDLIQAGFLGMVQGFTEFLPVSSSGHLVLIQKLLPGFSQPGITFDVILHFGTLLAVLIYFRNKLFTLSFKYIAFIIIGTVPAVIAGFLFRDSFEAMFTAGTFLWLEFMISGVINLLVDKPLIFKKVGQLGYLNSFLIGVSQAVSIIPAISRSGATIFTGVRLGIKKEDVAQFSFLLSLPAILGANILEIASHRNEMGSIINLNYITGFIVAFTVGLISIRLVYRFLEMNKFRYFGYYCFLMGVISLIVR